MRLSLVLILLAVSWGAARAQPAGGRIAAGAGSITAQGALTQINQASDRLIVDWQSFSIPAGARVDFAQPGAQAAVLNRVTGPDASALLGALTANGQVYLLNPHGILLGGSARVDTAGFIAATARLADADFLRGTDLAFTGGSEAAIVNRGTISATGGPIVFIARRVENAGVLRAPAGEVQLVGGTEVLLAAPGAPALILAGSAEGEAANSSAGVIDAVQVRLEAAGRNAAALAINQEGVVRATGIETRGGEVWLVGGAGRVEQHGEVVARNTDGTGGAIRANGGQLLLAAGSVTDARGPAGGGVIALGGADRGLPLLPGVANARATMVESGAQILADATVAGPGGRAVIWGTEMLGFHGTATAQGAGNSPGGWIETSGGWLDVLGRVFTGPGGTWLLDPYNIRIVDAASSGITLSGTNPVVGVPTGSESRLDVRVLEQALANQGTVILDTGSAGGDVGNIIFDAPLFFDGFSTSRLTLNADNDIFINRTITSTNGALHLDFNADADGNGQGSVILGADLITLGGSVTFQEDVVTTGSADLSILSGGGDIVFAGNLRIGNTNGLDLSSQGGDIYMATLSSATQANAILRLTDLSPANLYSRINALLNNPVPTPPATVGYESGLLVKRRTLRRVNNPPAYQTFAWVGTTGPRPAAGGQSHVSSANFGPTHSTDDSYMDVTVPNTPFWSQNASTGGKPTPDDSYMDVTFPNTPFWAQGPSNPGAGGGGKPPVDDSYMDFPFRPQTGSVSTPTTNGPRPPTDDSYMDVTVPNTPFWAQNKPPGGSGNPPGGTGKPPIDDSYMDFPPEPATGGSSGPANQVNPVIVQTDSGPVFSTVTTADANGPQVAPGQTTTTVSVVAPTSGSTTSTVTTAQPPIVVTGGPSQISSISNSTGALVVTQEHPTIQVGGPTTGAPTIVTQVVAQPQPVIQSETPRPVVAQAVPQVPVVSGPQNNAPALQAPNTPTVVATNATVVAVPSLPVVVNNPPTIAQPPAQQPGPVIVQAVPQVPTIDGPQHNAPALRAPDTPTVVATNPVAVAVPGLPIQATGTNPVAVPQPRPVVITGQAVPVVPHREHHQTPALQAPNPTTVVATQPAVVAVPSLPVVVNNPPAVAQPPPAQQPPVVAQLQPPLPVVGGPQNNAPALQAPNTPTVVATNPTVIAVPSLPVVVNNPSVVPQPPAQQPGPTIVQAVPQVPTVSGPQNNLPALQAPNTPTVMNQPVAVAVPSLPVVVNNPPVVPQPPAQQPGVVVAQAVPQVPTISGPQNNAPALQAPNLPTVTNQPTVVAVPSLPVVVNNPSVVPQPPAQQPGPTIVQAVPQVPTVSGPQNNLPALQAPNTPTVMNQPVAVAVPSLPVVVNNPPAVAQPPPAQQPPVVAQLQPPLPVVGGPQNNAPALQAPNTPTVVATNPTVIAVPSLPVVVNNPSVVPPPPAQQPGPTIVQAVPQVPTVSGPQNNLPALQAPNTPTVMNQPVAVAVPSLPVVVNNPPVVPQPPAQQPGVVVAQAVPQVPTISGLQNNAPALQAPNLPTVTNQPTVVAVPSLPVVVNNPSVVPQPPAQQPGVVVAQAVPQLPVVSGPQSNAPALQGPNTPTMTHQPTVVAVPTLPVGVNNPPLIPQPPGQPPGVVVATNVPSLPTVDGPQHNPPALQGPNNPTVTNQPVVVAVPSLPTTVTPPFTGVGPNPQPVVVTALSVPPLSLKEPTHPGAVQGPLTTTTVITQTTTMVGPPQTGGGPGGGSTPSKPQDPVTVSGGGGITGPVDPGRPGSGHGPDQPDGGGTTGNLPQQPGVTGSVVDTGSNQPDDKRPGPGLARMVVPSARKESELMGLHYSVIYRNYETQTLVDDIGRPLYALSSGYELFLFLEGRRPSPVAAPPLGAASPSR